MNSDSKKLDQIIFKQARNKKKPSDAFLISLHLAEELPTIKIIFGEQLNKQVKQLITEFADVTEEPKELIPHHREHLNHKLKLIVYPSRQRRNRLSLLK
jgi:hypothetical protein